MVELDIEYLELENDYREKITQLQYHIFGGLLFLAIVPTSTFAIVNSSFGQANSILSLILLAITIGCLPLGAYIFSLGFRNINEANKKLKSKLEELKSK